MAYKGRSFDSIYELVDYLNDVVVGGRSLQPVTRNLDGKTLKINDGTLKTVTFSGYELTPKEIIDQINAVVAGAASLKNYGHGTCAPNLAFLTAGLIIDKTGTANSIFGLSTTADVTVGANAIAKADIISITPDEGGNKFSVVHE